MKKILSYLRPHLPVIILQFFIKFSGTIVELFLPWMLSTILDDVAPTKDINKVLLWGGLMLLCAALALVGNAVANRMATKFSRNTILKIRHDLFERILYLSCSQTDQFTTSSLVSRLTADTYNVHHMIDRMQRLGIRAPILLLGGIIVTLTLEPVLTLVLIGTLPLLALVVWYVSGKGIPLYMQTQAALDVLVRKVQENMTGVRVIKALSKSELEKEKFDEANNDMVKRDRRAGLLMSVTNPAMNLFLNVGLTLVIVVGAFRVNAGLSQTGKIIAFLSYFTIILNSLLSISRLFVIYSKGAASAKRIAEVLETQEDLKTGEPDHVPSEYHIEFKNVNFSYKKVQNNLTDISFALRKGETLGIIGATGSGKSTIVNLLLRFYDTDSGHIRISGNKISSIPKKELHSMFGVVFQNDFLLADSIRENIDFGRFLTDSQIKAAAKTAQADFIYEKEGGFSSRLTVGGANLSGGQKQRLLIARALAANPEMLILDDSSSALDYKTDASLRKALLKNFSNTTTIIIAQRISSIMHADKIMMLDDGCIAGYGTHQELLDCCEGYREIYETQMGVAL